MLSCLAEKNQLWAQHAPVLIMVCSHSLFSHNEAENRWAEYDTGAATVSLCLQAASLGLVTHQMGGFDVVGAVEKFDIPSRFHPMSVLALGYQGDESRLDEGFRSMEAASRKRKPLAEICFDGAWKPLI